MNVYALNILLTRLALDVVRDLLAELVESGIL
jgi:hypothetical protein